jgi:C1A family cysteine protease
MKKTNRILCSLATLAVIGASSIPSSLAEDAAKAKAAADLRPAFQKWGLNPRAQGGRGTCSVFAMTATLEYAVATKRQQGARLSVEFLNWAANQVDGAPVDGGCFSDLWQGYAAHGVCPEADMPYQDGFQPDQKPSDAAIAHGKETLSLGLQLHWIKQWDASRGANDEEMAAIKKTLANGWPVCGGFLWPKNDGPLWKNGALHTCPRADVMDGHSILLVGYCDDQAQPGGGVFLIRNSAGASRDAMMTYEYVRTYMNDAAWIDFSGATAGGPRP